MKLLDRLTNRLSAPQVSRSRIILALSVALVADFLQIVLVPLEWMFIQQIIDVAAMAFMMGLLGFHPLLLPTFVIEFIPFVDMLPTWTGCVVAVTVLRRRQQGPGAGFTSPPQKPPPLLNDKRG